MRLRIIIFLIFASGIFWTLSSAEQPDWVSEYLEKGAVDIDPHQFYFSVGLSEESQDDADNSAKLRFQSQIEVKVKAVCEREIADSKGRITKDKFKKKSKVVVDGVMRGIPVSKRYEDEESGRYFSLIKMKKKDFDRISLEETKRMIEREYAIMREKHAGDEKTEAEKIRHKEVKSEHKEKKRQQHEKDRVSFQTWLRRIAGIESNFLSEIPPNSVITFHNGVIHPEFYEFTLKAGISPVRFDAFHCSVTPFKLPLALFMQTEMDDDKIQRQDGSIRVQLLPDKGKVFKTSIAFGFVEYSSGLADIPATKMQLTWSPLLTGNVTLPMYHTFASVYGDARKFSVGFDHYLWYDNFIGAVSLMLQMDLIYDKDWRNKYGDEFLIQGGFRFKPSKYMTASITYEEHDTFMFGTTIVLGKTPG
ncbi:MAG: hypothetical protein P9X24_05330 [Candidatus Hatepunaea meridiana]|nr:hypothetical protein [Candidatus Hatepunaea meridiana]